jgi:surfactin synthase thioesterase subunit
MSEPPLPDVWSYASALAAELVPFLDRPYAFIGHCGAFPYMIETTFSLLRLGSAPPSHLFASSWGAPHSGLYGRLNFADLDRLDIGAEITEVVRRRTGLRPSAQLIDLAGEALMADLRALWSEDDIVPPDEVWPSQWHEYATADYRLLDGDHWEFLRAPRALTDLIAITMQRGSRIADRARVRAAGVQLCS